MVDVKNRSGINFRDGTLEDTEERNSEQEFGEPMRKARDLDASTPEESSEEDHNFGLDEEIADKVQIKEEELEKLSETGDR